jgi:long-chain acyl-CoA synthetase
MTSQNMPWIQHYDPKVPISLEYPSITLVELFRKQVAESGNDSCIYFEDRTYSFRQVDYLSDKIRDGLFALGCRPGESIGLMMPNHPAFVIIFIGILKMGGVVVALNPTYQAREIVYQLKDSDTQVLFAMDYHKLVLEEVSQSLDLRKLILAHPEHRLSAVDVPTLISDDHIDQLPSKLIWLHELLSISGKSYPILEINLDSPAILQYSGGTTGVPKAAIGSHRNLISNVLQFSTWLQQKHTRQPILVAIPLFHVYGMVLGMLLAIQLGTPMILVASPGKGRGLFEAIRRFKPGIFPCVPSLYYAILHSEFLDEFKEDFKSLKVCISGSAPLPPVIKDEFESIISGRVVEGFGMSEAPTATHCNPVKGANKTGSIGMPLPDVECKIVSLDNPAVELTNGEPGEMLIRGPQVMRGYYNRDDETRIVLRNQWLYTGDIARMDEDGYFYILGRKKDLIKVGGLQVWPAEIEEVVQAYPGVAEAVVAGVTDERMGELPVVWLVPKPDSQVDLTSLADHCRQLLSRFKQPKELIIVDKIPRSTVGKILRRVLVEEYAMKKAAS